ncbi:hypothetical protein WOLCODRAFT_143200 [Wolfiporia cocos MD-104 SS10]|uniref:Uncharacterized protein n=1 Tax=Wolfiporia cocos (strain MD-104) TaxID=742152 RepID=A0A2H3JSI5_WOLCO|nr:hypothetical protein WOLCODRAFT_143200 [Wolfiporia cocos MD-104 SS10]
MGAVVSRRILQAWGSPSIPNHDLSQGSLIARQVSSVASDKVAQDDATAQRSLFIEEIAPFIDIIDLIFDYFEDPRAFRSLQARTGTLIAGSTALSFFTRRSFGTESDLDIYVYMPHCGEVGNWLLEAGYVFQHRRNEPTFEQMIADPASMVRREVDNYTIPGVARVLTFIRSVSDSDTQRQVHVVVALDNPLSVILGSHSTCVMNVIDYEKAYCLFARATIIERSTIFSASCLGLNRRRIEGQRKYAKRGYSIISCLTPITMNLLNPGELRSVECGKRFFFKDLGNTTHIEWDHSSAISNHKFGSKKL